MKTTYLLFFLTMSTLSLWGQTTGSVQGTVKTADGHPAEYVNVTIEGTSIGTVADWTGNYKLVNLKPGTYNLVASFIGLENQRQSVEVKAGESTVVHFILQENTQELEEVVVSSGR